MTTNAKKAEALKELEASLGWALIQEAIADDVLAAALGLANNPTMSKDEIDFRRGAIFAASGFSKLASRLRTRFENDALLEAAMAAKSKPTPDPAKAG